MKEMTIIAPSKYTRMYENAIDPVDTEIPDMSIDCTTEEGNKARMKARIVH